MFHFTIFAGSQAQLPPGDFTSVTIFAGTELKLPTLAQKIMYRKMRADYKPGFWERVTGSGRGLIFTLFGGTELKPPTVMEEYSAMRSLITSGAVTPAEVPALVEQINSRVGGDEWVTLTLFAGCVQEPNEREDELAAINSGARSGMISEQQRVTLSELVGAPSSTAATALGRMATGAA